LAGWLNSFFEGRGGSAYVFSARFFPAANEVFAGKAFKVVVVAAGQANRGQRALAKGGWELPPSANARLGLPGAPQRFGAVPHPAIPRAKTGNRPAAAVWSWVDLSEERVLGLFVDGFFGAGAPFSEGRRGPGGMAKNFWLGARRMTGGQEGFSRLRPTTRGGGPSSIFGGHGPVPSGGCDGG